MSVRPLDVALTIQRTPEINRSQTGEQVRPETAHQIFAERLSKEAQLQDKQVMQAYKPDENKVDRDGRRGGGGYPGAKKKQDEKKDDKKSKKPTGDRSMFDVSV